MKEIGLIVRQLNKLGQRQKILAVILVSVIMFRFYFNAVYKPRAAILHRLKSELVYLDNNILRLKGLMPDIEKQKDLLDKIGDKYANLKNQVYMLESDLPTQARIPQLLGKLIGEARGLDIEFVSIRPKHKKEKEYASLDIELKFNSAYSGLSNYLNRLENLSQFTKVIHVSIEETPETLEMKRGVAEGNSTILLTTLLGESPVQEPQNEVKAKMPLFAPTDQILLQRNPFTSRLKPVKEEELEEEEEYVLSGITLRGEHSTAIINDNVYRIDDVIGNKTLKQVRSNMVVLNNGKEDVIILMER